MGKEKIILLLILILGLGLRLINLNQSFWLDEAAQAIMSSKSLQFIWNERGGDFQPPLFYIIAHFWLQFGTTEVWLRLLPVTFGVVAIWVIYRFSDSLLAAFFLSINPFHVYYSQEFRMYSLVALLAILSMTALIKQSKWLWVWNILLLYTHYTTVFLLLAQLIYVFFFDRQKLKLMFFCILFSVFCYLPWSLQLFAQLNSAQQINAVLPGWSKVLSIGPMKAVPQILFKLTTGQINLYPKAWYVVYISSVLLTVSLVFILARKQRILLWLWIWVPIISIIFISFFLPMIQPFRLIYILPALILLMAQAAIRFPRLITTLIVYIAIVGNIMYFTRARLQREQWRQAIQFLQSQDADVVLRSNYKWAPLEWYAPKMAINNPTKNKVLVIEYLGQLTDPKDKTAQNLSDLKYKLTNKYNFEGVGLISEYTL